MDFLRPFTSGRWEYPCYDCSYAIEQQIPASTWTCDVQGEGAAQRLSIGICGLARRSSVDILCPTAQASRRRPDGHSVVTSVVWLVG